MQRFAKALAAFVSSVIALGGGVEAQGLPAPASPFKGWTGISPVDFEARLSATGAGAERGAHGDGSKTGRVRCHDEWPSVPARPSPRAKAWFAALFALAAAGCASPERLPPVPPADMLRAQPLGLANARFFPEDQPADLLAEFLHAIERQRHVLGLGPDAQLPPAELLALSGGGG